MVEYEGMEIPISYIQIEYAEEIDNYYYKGSMYHPNGYELKLYHGIKHEHTIAESTIEKIIKGEE